MRTPSPVEPTDMCSADCAIDSVLAAQSSATQTQIQFAIAAKSLDAAKQQGSAVNEMLAAAAQVGKAVGKGAAFDATA